MGDKIVHYLELDAKIADLSRLTEDELILFGTLSFICNELNVFSRMLGLANSTQVEAKPLKFVADLQHHAILRTLASRVFEAHEFLIVTLSKCTDVDDDLRDLLKSTKIKLDRLRSSEGYSINRNVRNEVTFHYQYGAAKKNVRSIRDDADASVFINKTDGNTYFSIGESLMYFERLRRFSLSDKTFEDEEKLAEAWLGWSLDAVRIIKDLQAEVFNSVMDKVEKRARKTHYFVERSLVAEKTDVLPIFSG